MNEPVAVIYLAYGAEGYQAYVNRFFDSYKAHASGAPHQLIIAATAYRDNPTGYETLRQLAIENDAKIIDLPDGGQEFGAFYRVAKCLTTDYIFCFVTSGRIMHPNWLAVFMSANQSHPQCRLIGSSGSWETSYPGLRVVLKRYFASNKPNRSQSSETTTRVPQHKRSISQIIKRLFDCISIYVQFPNYHIRTNGFLIERQLYMQYIDRYGMPRTRKEAYDIEHGRNHLSKFVKESGFDIGVVGANGILYAPHEWDKSATFRCPDISNAVIWDRQHDAYVEAGVSEKKRCEQRAWGYTITQ